MGALKQAQDIDLPMSIMRWLDDSKDGVTRDDLIEWTGHPDKDVVGALFKLRRSKFILIDEFRIPSVYRLTKLGKESLPPKYIEDHKKWKPDKGSKHVIGIAGKFDASKPLKGAMMLLYKALERPMQPFQLFKAANVEASNGYYYLNRMVKMEIVGTGEEVDPKSGKAITVYFRKMQLRTEPQPKEPPKPKLSAALPNDPILEAIADGAEPVQPILSNFSKINPSLDEAINELLPRFSPIDIIVACLAHAETQMRELTEFRDSVQRQFGDIVK